MCLFKNFNLFWLQFVIMLGVVLNLIRFGRSLTPLLSSIDKKIEVIRMEQSNEFSSIPQGNLKFLEYIGKLKHLKRTGWVLRNVSDPETVASHMYRMAVMSFLIEPNSNINRMRCMELAIIHDMAECIVGDITPMCGVSPEDKKHREEEAMVRLTKLIPNSSDYINQLFEEYEKQESPEARLVKEFDRLDMIIQAFEYEKQEGQKSAGRLEEFFSSAEGKFTTSFVQSIVDELKKQRTNCT